MSLKLNEKLLESLKISEAIAKQIEATGGNVQGAIHSIRSASTQVSLRVAAYREQVESDKAADQKAADGKAAADLLAEEEAAKQKAEAK